MPKLKKSWKDIEESTGGGFADIEPGAYVLTITKAEPHESQDYVRLYWDVAEGPSKGNYASSQYPPSDIISWKDAALGMLKHKLHVLADWNDGFQPTVAFEKDQWQLFEGKRMGAVVRRRLYSAGPRSKTPGADRVQMEIAAWLHPEEYRSGDFSERLLADRDQREKGAAPQVQADLPTPPSATPDLYDEDIPF